MLVNLSAISIANHLTSLLAAVLATYPSAVVMMQSSLLVPAMTIMKETATVSLCSLNVTHFYNKPYSIDCFSYIFRLALDLCHPSLNICFAKEFILCCKQMSLMDVMVMKWENGGVPAMESL